MPAPLANLHNRIMPLEEATVSVLDRGFLFGDAVYEVLRVYRGRPWLENEHFDRFAASLKAIRITGVDLEDLRRRMRQTIAAGPFEDAIVYLHVTRGAASRRHHAFGQSLIPFAWLFVEEYDDSLTAGQRQTGTKAITAPDLRWARC